MAISVDPDLTPSYMASDLGLYFLLRIVCPKRYVRPNDCSDLVNLYM